MAGKPEWVKLREAAQHFDNLVFNLTGYTVSEFRLMLAIAETGEVPEKASWWGREDLKTLIDQGIVRMHIDENQRARPIVTGRGWTFKKEILRQNAIICAAFEEASLVYDYEGNGLVTEMLDDILLITSLEESSDD